MRRTLFGLICALLLPIAAPAAVTYTVSQSAEGGGWIDSISAFNLDFTVPSLITTLTDIPVTDVNFSGVTIDSQNLSLLGLRIDPGLNIGAYQVGPGIPWIGLSFGRNGEQLSGEGICFDTPFPFLCASAAGATPFDHLGTYTAGNMTLTIATAGVPEPRFEWAIGSFALLLLTGMAHRRPFLRLAL